MSLRLIEIVLPEGYKQELLELLNEQDILDTWHETIDENRIHLKILLQTGKTENILDLLEKRFSHIGGFRIVIIPVEASIPRPEPQGKTQNEIEGALPSKEPASKIIRLSREELYTDIEKTIRLSWVFIVLIILSSIVASIGILRNNVIFIIGAMVIAPVLGPNVALSFATTLGDINLTRRTIKAIAVGIFTALIVSSLIGLVLKVNPDIPELISRTEVSMGDVVLALAAGSAAVLSFTSELFSALIGVMVAVALLPPLVTLGMLIGAGHWKLALGSLLLFLLNLICVNLAGVLTFLARGIRPLTWWEANKAKKAVRIAILLWGILLLTLVVIIIISQRS